MLEVFLLILCKV